VSAPDLLRRLGTQLDAAGIPFMVTGSIAAAFHGAGRATMDIDLVIEATPDQLHRLVASLSDPETYVSEEAAREALDREGMFNVVEIPSGWKADLIIRKSRPFSRSEFGRRQAFEFEGTRLWVTTLEDLIIAKLEWAKLGESARQLEDVAAMLRVADGKVDDHYLGRWITELDLGTQWLLAREASTRK
jgi:hypothetical protein